MIDIITNNIPYIKIIEQTKSRELVSEAMILYGTKLAEFCLSAFL